MTDPAMTDPHMPLQGPPECPFGNGDRVAVRIVGPDDEAWFAGTMVGSGRYGIVLASASGQNRMYVPWPLAVLRNVTDDEWRAGHADTPPAG